MEKNKEILSRIKISLIFAIFFIAILFIPGKWFGLTSSYINKQENSSHGGLSIATKEAIFSSQEDSNKDGIPNWKETLLSHASPENISSDSYLGDAHLQGTNGGVTSTVSSSHNTVIDSVPARLDDTQNVTSILVKNKTGLAVYLNNKGEADTKTIEQIGENVVAEAKKVAEAKVYSYADIKINNKEDIVSLKKYGNDIATIFTKAARTLIQEDDMALLTLYLSNNNVDELKKYDVKIKALDEAKTSLLLLACPPSAQETHLKAVNALENYKNTLYNFSKAHDDPARAFISAQDYQTVAQNTLSLYKDYGVYFDHKHIIFTQKDSAFIFTKVMLTP